MGRGPVRYTKHLALLGMVFPCIWYMFSGTNGTKYNRLDRGAVLKPAYGHVHAVGTCSGQIYKTPGALRRGVSPHLVYVLRYALDAVSMSGSPVRNGYPCTYDTNNVSSCNVRTPHMHARLIIKRTYIGKPISVDEVSLAAKHRPLLNNVAHVGNPL
ncbi:hypothetical protein J6590_086032 [Homalodisca vitripennis]|nr:hypothetical protein J6590_086032 [Homalodisca vitripennis]